jgi:hypothetical protein
VEEHTNRSLFAVITSGIDEAQSVRPSISRTPAMFTPQ